MNNRRNFLKLAGALAAAIPFAAAARNESAEGLRLTGSTPPEEGFTHIGHRRYRVFCNGRELKGVIRVDTGRNIAWVYARGTDGNVMVDRLRMEAVEREIHGSLRLERIR